MLQLCIFFLFLLNSVKGTTWSEWWTYDGISGPEFWGLVNPEWVLCSRGKKQSPINIEPSVLLYDPQLKPLVVDKRKVSGRLTNTGHSVKILLDDWPNDYVNISSGPLSYNYRLFELEIHFGGHEEVGSEHAVHGKHYPAELQLLGYNSELYSNSTSATNYGHGLVAISVLVKVGNKSNTEFGSIINHLKMIKYKGQNARVRPISIFDLLPKTDEYVTYEGSLTFPGCQESVTWIIYNKPIYATQQQLTQCRVIMQGDELIPKFSMQNNFRPVMPSNNRLIRTNINNKNNNCIIDKRLIYKGNTLDGK